MENHFRTQAVRFLEILADALDIPAEQQILASERYNSVGNWLTRKNSTVVQYDPVIYPQGSFLIGTVTELVSVKDGYDIDLVCLLNLSKDAISQEQLKDLVGNEINSYATANHMNSHAEGGQRCWKLQYADGAQFHMDILPAIPEDDHVKSKLVELNVVPSWTPHAIAITDRKASNYERIDNNWPSSNPKGYAEWFKRQMKAIALQRLQQLVEMKKYSSIEEVPLFEWKTPLQRAIQILKRHRDVLFIEDQKNKPVSIIITTLAARAYDNEPNLLDALVKILDTMHGYIEQRNDQFWVANPVNPEENFADKWQEHPQRKEKFMYWLGQVKSDFEQAVEAGDSGSFVQLLKPRFGDRVIEKVAAQILPASGLTAIIKDSEMVPHVNIRTPNKAWGRE